MLKAAAIAITVLFALPSERMSSCAVQDIATTFTEAHAVFVGRVIEAYSARTGPELFDVQTFTTLKVERLWKGPLSRTLQVVTCGGENVGCSLDPNFQPGGSYLVMAYGNTLMTSSCETKRTEDSVDDLLWLASKPSRRLPD